jgi:hypothetical protein
MIRFSVRGGRIKKGANADSLLRKRRLFAFVKQKGYCAISC